MGVPQQMSTTARGALPCIVVVGGSFVGVQTAQVLARAMHSTHRVLLVEQNSHFQYLFAFPRYAAIPGIDTRRAFIPFDPAAFADVPEGSGRVVQARVSEVTRGEVLLDREVEVDGQDGGKMVDRVPYDFLVIATGTRTTPPATLPGTSKPSGVSFFASHSARIAASSRITIIGGGAVGVQMACDIADVYPTKTVTLVHSRTQLMNRFDARLSEIVLERMEELGVLLRLGSRVKLPEGGRYPANGGEFEVELESGERLPTDFAVVCTGQTPNSGLLTKLAPKAIKPSGFVRVKKTLQIEDESLPNVFCVGDIADCGAPKAAWPGWAQADIIAANVRNLLDGTPLVEYEPAPAGIRLSLGVKKYIVFKDPPQEPMLERFDTGKMDFDIETVWRMKGGGDDYDL